MSKNVIQFCARLEEKLDTCLFRRKDDDDLNSATPRTTDPAVIAKGAARTAVAGGVIAGGALAHRAVMDGYGGTASGSAVQAYRNLGRNAVRGVTAPLTAAAGRAGDAYTTAREIGGLNPAMAGARAAKKALNPLLSRARGLIRRA